MRFNAKAEYVPGKLLVVADTFYRHPSSPPQLGSVELTDDITALEESTRAAWPMSHSRLSEGVESKKADPELQTVMRYVKQGWPKYYSQLPEYVKPHYAVRDMLSVCHDLLIYSGRIVIPNSMRAEVKEKLHDGHMGIVKSVQNRAFVCLALARRSRYLQKILHIVKQISLHNIENL